MASAADHVRMSELFETLEETAGAMTQALEGHAPGRGRLARSSSMLSSVVAKLRTELDHLARAELHADLRKADVTMFAGPTENRESARELVMALHPEGE